MLMICYYWPPAGGPGSLRAVKFARYLPQFGWEPVILTVQKGEFPYNDPSLEKDLSVKTRVYRTKSWEPFFLYKKMTHKKKDDRLPVGLLTLKKHNIREKITAWIRANIFVPDARIGWIPFAVNEGLKIIKKEKIDLVLTSSPPHSLQLIGLILKKISRLPWIADLRDPWTHIRYYQFIKRNVCISKIDQLIEKKVLREADHVTTVSPSLVSAFKSKENMFNNNKISLLPHGYDENDFRQVKRNQPIKFQITHTGNLLEHQNPKILWQSLKQILQQIPDFKDNLLIRFIGRTHPSILESIHYYGLTAFFQSQSFLPHNLIIQEIVDSSLLLVVIPEIEDNKGIITTKLLEYLGSRNPILIIGPQDGDVAKIISNISNSRICEYQNIDRCMEFIQKMYTAWKKKKLPILKQQKNPDYSRYEIAKTLSHIHIAQ